MEAALNLIAERGEEGVTLRELTDAADVPSSAAALNGALLHALIRPDAIAHATGIYVGIANIASAIGPALFGVLINATGGQFAGGFLFLALLGIVGACCYFALHQLSNLPERSLAAGARDRFNGLN